MSENEKDDPFTDALTEGVMAAARAGEIDSPLKRANASLILWGTHLIGLPDELVEALRMMCRVIFDGRESITLAEYDAFSKAASYFADIPGVPGPAGSHAVALAMCLVELVDFESEAP